MEFAVALPLLVVFVVGIFDFSGAFTLKQKLTNAARDGARVAAADPATDLRNGNGTPQPTSINDAFYAVDDYLLANNISDCGLGTNISNATVSGLTWTFTAASSSGPPCGITLIIDRGYYFPLATLAPPPGATCAPPQPGAGQTQVVGTCISIKYAYQWRFGQAASLLGNNTMLPSTIFVAAVAMNEN